MRAQCYFHICGLFWSILVTGAFDKSFTRAPSATSISVAVTIPDIKDERLSRAINDALLPPSSTWSSQIFLPKVLREVSVPIRHQTKLYNATPHHPYSLKEPSLCRGWVRWYAINYMVFRLIVFNKMCFFKQSGSKYYMLISKYDIWLNCVWANMFK